MPRTNWKQVNNQLVRILNNLMNNKLDVWYTNDTGERKANIGTFYIGYAYNQPRLQVIISEDGGDKNISDRLPAKELNRWLNGFLSGIVQSGCNRF